MITTTVRIGNSIIRHLDPKVIPIIYGDYPNEDNAFEITEVKSMLDELIALLRRSEIFDENLFKQFDNLVEYAQIKRQLNLEIDNNRLSFFEINSH